jgi:hypothetical protein
MKQSIGDKSLVIVNGTPEELARGRVILGDVSDDLLNRRCQQTRPV